MYPKPWRTACLLIAVVLLPLPVPAQEANNEPIDNVDTVDSGAPGENEEPAGRVIDGIVLNHYGGGIAGATVRLESPDASADAPPLAEATTGQFGDVSVRLPEEAADLEAVRVRIVTEGFADWVGELDLADEWNEPFIDATLEGVNTLKGTVLTAVGDKPIADALISCDNGGRQIHTRSDEKGRFEFDNLFEGGAMLTINAKDFALERRPVNIDSDESEITIHLLPERPIELKVITNEGDPARGLFVEALVKPDNQYLSANTDEQGLATLHGLSINAGEIALRLNGERYVRMTGFEQAVELPAATQPAADESPAPLRKTVVVTVAAAIKGTVVDKDSGRPVVGVRVIAGRRQRYDMPMTWTSIDGTYELLGLEPGLNVVTFQPSEHAPVVRELQLKTGRTETIDLKLSAGETVAGVVVGGDDQPIEEVRVCAEEWKGYRTLGLRTITDADGKFEFAHVPEGEILFSFVKPGFGAPIELKLASGSTDCRIALTDASAPAQQPLDLPARIAVGQQVPDLTITATDGTVYKLSDLRGKYVFLDFWASWCGPCLGEIPNVKKLRSETANRANFVLIGVSLDRKRDDFKQTVDDFEMDWPQAFGPKSGAEEAFNALEGMAIPYTCLIGPDGKLIAQHLRGEKLATEVLKHLPAR